MARSLIIAAVGSGSDDPEDFRRTCRAFADQVDREGSAGFAGYGSGATRLQLKRKDPQGYKVFLDLLAATPPSAPPTSCVGLQAGRPPIYVWEKQLELIRIPTLILCGDEDEACVKPSLFMKRHIPGSGLAFLPRSGHGINL